jgi:multiple sugar transport system substrate-binding protein
MNRWKCVRVMAVLALVLALVSACAPKATPVPATTVPPTAVPPTAVPPTPVPPTAVPPTPVPSEPIEITIWNWEYKTLDDYNDKMFAIFEQQNPGVKVVRSIFPPVGEGGYSQKLLTALATGTGPDIFFITDGEAATYASRNLILSLEDSGLKAMGFASMDELYKTLGYLPAGLNGWRVGGKTYGLPNEVSWLALFVNKDCMTDSGIDPDTVKLDTWDDYIAVANKMSRFDDKGNFTREGADLPTYLDDTWTMLIVNMFMVQSGGHIISPDGTEAWINKPEAVNGFREMLKIVRNGKTGSPDFGTPGISGMVTDWIAGENTCMLISVPVIPTLVKFPVVSYAIPRMASGGPGDTMFGWAWQVNAASKHPDLAWKLMRQMCSDAESHCAEAGFLFPIANLMESPCVKANPGAPGLQASLDKSNPQFIFSSPVYPEIASIVRKAYELCVFEGSDVQATMDDAAAEINEALKSGG